MCKRPQTHVGNFVHHRLGGLEVGQLRQAAMKNGNA
jgi:hypothetical protein